MTFFELSVDRVRIDSDQLTESTPTIAHSYLYVVCQCVTRIYVYELFDTSNKLTLSINHHRKKYPAHKSSSKDNSATEK